MLVGLSVTISTIATFAALGPGTPDWCIAAVLAIFGWSTAMSLVVVSALAYIDMPDAQAGDATGLYTTAQQLSFSIGIVGGVAAAGIGAWVVGGDGHSPATYSVCFLLLAAVASLVLLLALRLRPDVGEELRR
jgi:MFS family permease